MHTTLFASFTSPLPLTLSCVLVLVYKPLIHLCIRHLEYQLAYPSTQHLILPVLAVKPKHQLPQAEPLSFTTTLAMLLSAKASLRLNPKSPKFGYTLNIQTKLVGRHSVSSCATALLTSWELVWRGSDIGFSSCTVPTY